MGEPTIVVLPPSGQGTQNTDQEASEITATIQQALHERSHPKPAEVEHDGPLKQVLARSDSLYKYINWESPSRTLGSYLGALSVLFGAHYLPLTQYALKAGMTAFGVVSVTEFASRSFSHDSLSTRLRPKEYRTVPESTLNATLKDIHDLVQYSVVQFQKVLYGQDLNKTFATFLGFTALYFLIQILTPFQLAVLGLTSIFVAPLVASPQGQKVAHDAGARAQELASSTAVKSRELAQDASVKTQELANATAEKGRGLVQSGQVKANELGGKTRQAANDAANTAGNVAQNGKQTASNLSARAGDIASDASGNVSSLSGNAVDNARKLPQAGANAVNQAPGAVSSAFDSAKRYLGGASNQDNTESNYKTSGSSYNDNSSSENVGEISGGNPFRKGPGSESITDEATSDVYHSADIDSRTPRVTAPVGNAGTVPGSEHSKTAARSLLA